MSFIPYGVAVSANLAITAINVLLTALLLWGLVRISGVVKLLQANLQKLAQATTYTQAETGHLTRLYAQGEKAVARESRPGGVELLGNPEDLPAHGPKARE